MKSSSSSAGVDETNDTDSLEENHIKQCLLRDVCCVSIYLTALETEEEGVGGGCVFHHHPNGKRKYL